MQLKELFNKFIDNLSGAYDPSEAEAITWFIFNEWADLSKNAIIKEPGLELSSEMEAKFLSALALLLQHKPVQQITGTSWFYNLKFYINEHVLIPRPETEELVDRVIKENKNATNLEIIDLGTGSGCIPVAIKKHLPSAILTAIDISDEALQVAKKNAADHGIEIAFKKLDFLNEASWNALSHYDIITSNPPYIPFADKSTMDNNVTRYEPSLALFTAGDDHLIFYRKIYAFALNHLKKGGSVYLETHKDYAHEVAALFHENNLFEQTDVIKDISGNERMVRATHFLKP